MQARGDVGKYFRQQEQAATHQHWQLIQLADTPTPGLFKAWVLVDTKLYSVPITVPRSFFVDSELPPDHPSAPRFPNAEVKLAQRTLPAGRKPAYLYQVTMSEADYHANHAHMAAQLAASQIRGCYEDRLPLSLQAALQLGCVVRVDPAFRKRPLTEGFGLNQLRMRNTTECSYLEGACYMGG